MSDSETPTIYIYGLVDPRDGSTRYVGKTGNLVQRLRSHTSNANNPRVARTPVLAWIGELLDLGMSPEIRVIQVSAGETWGEDERAAIASLRGTGLLFNVRAGGEGRAINSDPPDVHLFCARFPVSLHAKMRATAAAHGRSLNQEIVQAIRELVARHESEAGGPEN